MFTLRMTENSVCQITQVLLYMDWRWQSWISDQHKQCSMLDFLMKQKSYTMVRTTSVAFLSSLVPMVAVVKEN
jgi:hypothetical protein